MASRLCIYFRLSHLGVGTKSGTENRELRVGNILGADIPAETRQSGKVEHAERFTVLVGDVIKRRVVDDHFCLASSIFYHCFIFIGIGSYQTGTVTATIDIVVLLETSRENFIIGKAEELLGILIRQNSIDGSLRLSFWKFFDVFCLQDIFCYLFKFSNGVTDFLALSLRSQPGGDIAVDISILVPNPGSAIYLYLGVAQDVGVGSLVFGILFSENFLGILVLFRNFNIAVASTEDVTTQHTALDMHQSVAIYCTIGTAAIDVVPDGWHGITVIIECDGIDCGSRSIGNVDEGVAVDTTHLFVFWGFNFRQTLATAKYGTEDVAADDIYTRIVITCLIALAGIYLTRFGVYACNTCRFLTIIRFIIFIFFTNIRNVSTAINLAIDFGIIGNLYKGSSFDTCYIGEVNVFFLLCFLWFYASTTAKYIAIDISALHIYC